MFSYCKCICFYLDMQNISVTKDFRMCFCDIFLYFFVGARILCKFAKADIKTFHAYTELWLWQENFIL